MIWQDIVIMLACFSFPIALIPTIRGKEKPAKSTCIMVMTALSIVAVCFGTLGLWLSMISEIAGVTAWGVLLFQRRGK